MVFAWLRGMTRAWVRGDSASQPALLPADPADLLPADRRAWAVLGFVAELDLSEFVAAYRVDGRGRPPYDPAMMVALVSTPTRRASSPARASPRRAWTIWARG
jgi:hypothetical protein